MRLTRVHMEEDAGKNVHASGGDSVVDLNRSGVPLVEIVGEPDLRSGAEAAEYLRRLREVLLFLGVNDGNLEEGSFRCDANVSIRPVGETKLGTRVELKNINSFRFVEKAIDHEVLRQEAVLDEGGRSRQETRGWDEKTGTTYSLRSKEEAQDYRYFPDPDLPPLVLDDAFVERVRRATPELPRVKRARFVASRSRCRRRPRRCSRSTRAIAAFFEETATTARRPAARSANFVQSEVLRDVTTHGLAADVPVTRGAARRAARGSCTRGRSAASRRRRSTPGSATTSGSGGRGAAPDRGGRRAPARDRAGERRRGHRRGVRGGDRRKPKTGDRVSRGQARRSSGSSSGR